MKYIIKTKESKREFDSMMRDDAYEAYMSSCNVLKSAGIQFETEIINDADESVRGISDGVNNG